jgi:hypothetical protein
MGWKKYVGPEVRSTLVMGDEGSPPTRWWNHLWLALWGWKTTVVFQVQREAVERGYRVGYRSFDGNSMIEDVVNFDRQFRVKIGHEDCAFFAIMKNGLETPLSLVARTDVSDARHQTVPLH